jgi:hypothetical protein
VPAARSEPVLGDLIGGAREMRPLWVLARTRERMSGQKTRSAATPSETATTDQKDCSGSAVIACERISISVKHIHSPPAGTWQ